MLESLDVRGNVVESAEEAVRTLQWRNTPRALPSWASPGATRLKYSDAGGQYHCPLLTLFGRPQRSLWVDPFYYEWSLCECEYGFYVNPTETAQPPHCTPFPTRVNVTGRVGSFSDGVMGGRVRTGMDTKWHLKANPAALVDPNATSAASPPRVLAINLLVEELDLGNESTIFVYAGDSRLDRRVARLSGEETTQDTVSITVRSGETIERGREWRQAAVKRLSTRAIPNTQINAHTRVPTSLRAHVTCCAKPLGPLFATFP